MKSSLFPLWSQLSRDNRVFSAHLSRRILFCRRQLIANGGQCLPGSCRVRRSRRPPSRLRRRRFIAEFIVSALSLRFSGLANVDDVNAVGCNSRKGRWRRRRRLIYLQAVRPPLKIRKTGNITRRRLPDERACQRTQAPRSPRRTPRSTSGPPCFASELPGEERGRRRYERTSRPRTVTDLATDSGVGVRNDLRAVFLSIAAYLELLSSAKKRIFVRLSSGAAAERGGEFSGDLISRNFFAHPKNVWKSSPPIPISWTVSESGPLSHDP